MNNAYRPQDIIEKWLNENNYSFTKFNEPEEFFHIIVKESRLSKAPIEIYQKKDSSNIEIGMMNIMADKMLDTYVKFTESERSDFVNEVEQLIRSFTIRFNIHDNETTFVVSIIDQIPFIDFNKELLINTIDYILKLQQKVIELTRKILNSK